MTTNEALKKAHLRQDAVLAGKVSDTLRAAGVSYTGQCRMYAEANGMNKRDATDEWEELMAEADVGGME